MQNLYQPSLQGLFKPIQLWAFIAAILLALSSGRLALAADPTVADSDPIHPLTPGNAWVVVDQGERHWYAFHEEGDGAAITVRMTVLPPQSATFRVLTPAQSVQWQRGENVAPVGAGSPHTFFNNDFYWTGSFVQSGLYYVLVENSGRGLASYRLTISGDDISFPTTQLRFASPIDQYAADITLAVAPPAMPNTEQGTGNAPPTANAETPLPPVGQTWRIESGVEHWYAFRDEGDAASIQVQADATPDTCLTFQVWTPDQLRLWQVGEPFQPIGQGTPNRTLKADLFWTGSFVKSGAYYVIAKRAPTASGSCVYKLWVMGDDVSLVLPPGRD